MGKVRVTELGYLGFEVSDLDAWRTLAAEVLGMEFIVEGEGARVRLDYWHQRLILTKGPSDDLAFAGFRLPGPEEFWAMRRQLEQIGVTHSVAPDSEAEDRCVLELMRLEDPAGVPIEIFHGPQVDRHAPMHPGRGMHGHFKAGECGMGHIVIRDRGREASDRFYREALGMRGSIEARVKFNGQNIAPVFMHCNPRGHSVAFGVPNVTKRLQHFMVEVDHLDDVGLALERCKERQIPILMGLGRHQNDQMVSFYVQTPSGFFLEYGWGGQESLRQSEYNASGQVWGHELLSPQLLS